jgi:hypothetical protein
MGRERRLPVSAGDSSVTLNGPMACAITCSIAEQRKIERTAKTARPSEKLEPSRRTCDSPGTTCPGMRLQIRAVKTFAGGEIDLDSEVRY